MKSIAIVVNSLSVGGAERIAGLLSCYLVKCFKVFLFVEKTDQITYAYSGTLVPMRDVIPEINGVFLDQVLLKLLKEKYRIDVTISFLGYWNYVNVCSKQRDLVIISERCANTERTLVEERYIYDNYRKADAVVACSYGVQKDLVERYGICEQRIRTIYNYIDIEGIKEKSQEPLNSEIAEFLKGSPFFVGVGRLEKQKNYERMIRQFSVFHRRDSIGIKLVIIGNGSLEKELKDLIDDLRLNEWIHIFHYMNNPFCVMREAEALIVTSRREGLPNVILEGFVIGCTIISNDCMAGPRELILGEKRYEYKFEETVIAPRGILVPDLNTEDECITTWLADSMQWICENRDACLQMHNNQARYIKQYSNEYITQEWKNVINMPDNSVCVKESIQIPDHISKIYIYGAGTYGKAYYRYLRECGIVIEAFLITDSSECDDEYEIPILCYNTLDLSQSDVLVIVGVSHRWEQEICANLVKEGVKRVGIIKPDGYLEVKEIYDKLL